MYAGRCCPKENFLLQELHINMPPCDDVGSLSVFASKSVSESKHKESYIQQKINKLSNGCRQYSVRKFSEMSRLKKMVVELRTAYGTASTLMLILVRLLIIIMVVIDGVVSLIGACKSSLMNKISGDHPSAVFLSYYSKGDKVNYNCLACRNNKYITCDHLSYWWVSKKKPNFDDINSLEKISNNHEIPDNKKLDNEYYFSACPSVAFYFEINQFPEVLSKIAVTLKEGEEQRYKFESCNHGMGIAIKKHQNNIIIRYYDPNDTLRQKTIIVSSENDLKTLSCNDLLSSTAKNTYFQDDYQVGCLVSLDRKVDQSDCWVECLARQCKTLIFLLSSNGHYGHDRTLFCLNGIKKNITRKLFLENNNKGISAIVASCQRGHPEAIKAYIEDVCIANLNQDEKEIELLGKNKNGMNALSVAMHYGHHKAVKVFIEAILSSDMNDDKKEYFIAGKNENESPVLLRAFHRGQYEAIKVYMEDIITSNLNEKRKEILLSGKIKSNISALHIARLFKYNEVIKVYSDVILKSNLNKNVKDRLLLE